VRRGDRDPTKFNEAADLAANSIMKGASFKLPKGALFPGEGKYKDFASDLSAEEYYVMLPPDPPPSESNDGQGDGGGNGEGQDENVSDSVRPGRDPGRTGEVRDPGQGSPAEKADAKADWEVAVAQAEQAAKQRGPLPAGLARMVDQVLRTPADWRAILREFVSQQARNDFSWSKPNRRFIAQGLYLPGLHSEELGEVVIMVDCSGSVGPNELAMFGSEIDGILSSYECEATILYHDVEVVGVEHWRSSDGPLKLEPVGGGGTSHRPAFDWVSGAHQGSGAACVVALTDLYTEFPRQAPDVPVLWAVVGNKGAEAPFGRIIHLD
jgi:predicted metal-dependent peptidase